MCYRTNVGPKPVCCNVITVAVFIALLIILFTARPAAAQDGALAPEAQRIFEMVNQARSDNGLPPLAVNAQLNLAAQRHVDDVIANGNWGHYGSDGSTVAVRTARAGYGSSWVSEDWVAAGSPDQAMNWWMNDWIHRVNILTPRWDDIGIGAAPARNGFWIFVTDFGNADGTAAVAAQALGATAAEIAEPRAAVEAVPANGLDYTIRGGDTLLGIGLRYGIDWQDIALANGMEEADVLAIGQVIRLPGRAGAADATTVSRAVVAISDQTHTVRPGETLWTIAARFGVAWQDVAAVNGLGEYSLLQIGQELKLPATVDDDATATTGDAGSDADDSLTGATAGAGETGAAPVALTPPTENGKDTEGETVAGRPTLVLTVPAAGVAYTVRAGDTLSGIAARNDITWQALAAANGMTENSYLQIGQELTIPAVATQPLRLQQTTGGVGGQIVEQRAAARSYTVQRGDTIFAIAMRKDVDWQELLQVNNLTEESILQPGQTIQLP